MSDFCFTCELLLLISYRCVYMKDWLSRFLILLVQFYGFVRSLGQLSNHCQVCCLRYVHVFTGTSVCMCAYACVLLSVRLVHVEVVTCLKHTYLTYAQTVDQHIFTVKAGRVKAFGGRGPENT